jgi:hypothetical protein
MDDTNAVSGARQKSHAHRALLGLALAFALGGVFYLYSNPQLVIMLTDQLWACF